MSKKSGFRQPNNQRSVEWKYWKKRWRTEITWEQITLSDTQQFISVSLPIFSKFYSSHTQANKYVKIWRYLLRKIGLFVVSSAQKVGRTDRSILLFRLDAIDQIIKQRKWTIEAFTEWISYPECCLLENGSNKFFFKRCVEFSKLRFYVQPLFCYLFFEQGF